VYQFFVRLLWYSVFYTGLYAWIDQLYLPHKDDGMTWTYAAILLLLTFIMRLYRHVSNYIDAFE
jgi:hypothetical protein